MVARIFRYLGVFVGGVLLGTLGTIGHEQQAQWLGHIVPWGIIVGFIGTAAYLVGVRLLSVGRTEAIAAAIGILLAVAVLSVEGPGGSVLVRTGVLGNFWEYGPAIIALIVIAWPALPAPSSRTASPRQAG